MAWTDYSSTDASAWVPFLLQATNPGLTAVIDDPLEPACAINHASIEIPLRTLVIPLATNYNIPGFDDGFAPATPDPIANNIDEGGGGGDPGGGGSTRPGSGMIYPRGTC